MQRRPKKRLVDVFTIATVSDDRAHFHLPSTSGRLGRCFAAMVAAADAVDELAHPRHDRAALASPLRSRFRPRRAVRLVDRHRLRRLRYGPARLRVLADTRARETAARDAAGGESGDPLGVVVAAHNEAGVLSLTLSALFTQSEPPDLVVIADDGSTDGTAALLEASFGLAPPMVGAISAAGGFGRLGHRCFGSGHTD